MTQRSSNYNRDLFDAAGVPYPRNGWTWDDFLLAAQALTDADSGVFGFVSDPAGGVPGYFIYQHGGDLVDDWAGPTRFTLEDRLAIEAVERFARLIHDHGVHPTPAQRRRVVGGDGQNGAYRCIAQGRAAMWVGGFSERGGRTWLAPWQFGAGMVTLPRETYSATGVNFDAYLISAAADKPEAAWEWIAFLSHQFHGRQAPARRSLVECEAFREQRMPPTGRPVRAHLGLHGRHRMGYATRPHPGTTRPPRRRWPPSPGGRPRGCP